MNTKFNSAFWVCTLMIVVGGALRLTANYLHLWNFSPVAAMALFAGVRFKDKKFSFIIPIGMMFLTDLIIGLHSEMLPVYFSFALVCCIGILVSRKENVFTVLFGSLSSSIIFFLITNLVIWYATSLYPHSLPGQFQSYIAALPFFRNTVAGDLIYTGAFFGSWYLIKRSNPTLAKA